MKHSPGLTQKIIFFRRLAYLTNSYHENILPRIP